MICIKAMKPSVQGKTANIISFKYMLLKKTIITVAFICPVIANVI